MFSLLWNFPKDNLLLNRSASPPTPPPQQSNSIKTLLNGKPNFRCDYVWAGVPKPFSSFPGGSDGRESARNVGDPTSLLEPQRFPWRRKWQPAPVFLPGVSPRQRTGDLHSMGSQRVRQDWVSDTSTSPFLSPYSVRRWQESQVRKVRTPSGAVAIEAILMQSMLIHSCTMIS